MENDSLSDILRKEGNSQLEESKQIDDYDSKRNKIIDSIICYEESLKIAINKTEEYKALKNLCVANVILFEETLRLRENDLEGLFNICLEFIKNYQNTISLGYEMEHNILLMEEKLTYFIDEIIDKISNSKKLSEEENLSYFYQINSILMWSVPQAKDKITQKILNMHLIKGINHYDKKDYVNSLSELNLGLILGREREKYSYIIENYDEENEKINEVNDYLMRIQFFLCIDKCDHNLKKGLFESEEMDMKRINIAIETCREAIQISEAITDKEIECIAYSKLLKIYHKIFKIASKVRQTSNHLKSLLDSLNYKKFEGQEWYDESIKIFDIIKTYESSYDNEIEISKNKQKLEIKKIEEAFGVSEKHFINFIFKNHPPSDIPLNFNVEKASVNLREKIKTIIKIFHPNKAKCTPEKYVIYTEILKFLNRISDDYDKENEYDDLKTSASG